MPWRNPRHVRQSFMKSMGWTDKMLLQTLDPDKVITNESNAKAIGMDASDVNRSALPAQCCINCFCDCKTKYATMQQCNGKENAVENITMTQKNNPENANRSMCEHTNRSTKNCKFIKPRTCMITGGIELVPLLAKRRAMQRPISLSTTDVTKYPTEKKFDENSLMQCGRSHKTHYMCFFSFFLFFQFLLLDGRITV